MHKIVTTTEKTTTTTINGALDKAFIHTHKSI